MQSERHGAVPQLLQVERLELNVFRGNSADVGSHSVFGGQVLGQALMAAAHTVESGSLHSLHANFLRAGDIAHPILYMVERTRDGSSFTSRRVVAVQHGRPIFTAALSFHLREEGIEHQGVPMPDVPSPEEVLASGQTGDMVRRLPDGIRAWYERERPFDLLELPTSRRPEEGPRMHYMWLKPVVPFQGSAALTQAMLAYISDFNILHAALWPHVLVYGLPHLMVASLDHAMWFHRDFTLDDWLLYATESPVAGGGRALCRGSFYTRDGKLVATVMQEGLVRQLNDNARAAPPASSSAASKRA